MEKTSRRLHLHRIRREPPAAYQAHGPLRVLLESFGPPIGAAFLPTLAQHETPPVSCGRVLDLISGPAKLIFSLAPCITYKACDLVSPVSQDGGYF